MGRGLKIKMYDLIYYILQAMEIVLFVKGIVRLKFNKNKAKFISGITVLLLGAAVYAFSPNENVSMAAGRIILQTVGTVLLFDAGWIEGVVKYMFASSYVSVLRMPMNLIFTILDVVTEQGLSDDIRKIIVLLVNILLIVIISKCIGKHKGMVAWIKEIPLGYFVLAYLCGTATEGIAAGIRYVASKVNQATRMILSVLGFIVSMFLYAVGFGFAVANLWRKYYKRESELKDEYIKKTKDYYQALTEHMKEIRSIRHDMNSHLNMIDRYAEEGALDKLRKYIGAIRDQSGHSNSVIVNVGNSIVSAVLTDAMRKVDNEEKISIVYDGTMPEGLLISDYNLCTIFSNLVSNSIDACRKLKDSDRQIHMEFAMDRKSLSIICKNPIEWEVNEEQLNGGYTSKKDMTAHGMHGISRGIKSISFWWWDMTMTLT